MSQPLPRLRMDLDFMPSPVEDRPGLLIRDPFQFSDTTLIVPPPLVQCLELFDGEHDTLDLRQALVKITGDIEVGDIESHLTGALSGAGFLEDVAFQAMRESAMKEFAESDVREPTHAGSAYP